MSRATAAFGLALTLLASGCPERVDPPASPAPTPSPTEADRGDPPPSDGVKRVALFLPHEDLFWRDFRSFMESASSQLGLDLQIHMAENNRELMKEQLREACSGQGRVDAVVFQNFKQCGEDLLRIADEAGVPAFLVNTGVEASCGAPRERYSHWIGTMLSDSEAAGHALGCLLADQAQRQGLVDADGKVHMIGLAGIVSDGGSAERVQGLERAVAERGDIVLYQIVPTDWSREEGQRKALELLKRFPSTAVVWTASDPLALGAIESIRSSGRTPGSDVLVGGFDWTTEALEAIRSGELHTTIGGHFMEGGWVAVLLHDYFTGHDFAPHVEFQTPMRPITKQNVDRFHATIKAAEWSRLDFDALAKPAAGQYAFDPVQALDQLSD